MNSSGLDRAGLPETESLTSQRSSQGSKTTEGRQGAPRARADLDGETDVIGWVDTATRPPLHSTEMGLPASAARRARVAWKVPASRQSVTFGQDQAQQRAPGMGIPVFAPAKGPHTQFDEAVSTHLLYATDVGDTRSDSLLGVRFAFDLVPH